MTGLKVPPSREVSRFTEAEELDNDIEMIMERIVAHGFDIESLELNIVQRLRSWSLRQIRDLLETIDEIIEAILSSIPSVVTSQLSPDVEEWLLA